MSQEFEDAFGDDEVQPARGGHRHDDPEPELVFARAVEFFANLLAQTNVREVREGDANAGRPEWYKHPEALIRMKAFWRTSEHLRLEPALGVSTWCLNHAGAGTAAVDPDGG